MKKHVRVQLLVCVALVMGCRPRSSPRDGGALPLQEDAGQTVVLQLSIETEQTDGGVLHAHLDPTTEAWIPVTQSLVISANLPLRNYRIRLFDELDRAMVSEDVPEETGNGLRYHVNLASPLRPGHRYAVLVDAQNGTTFADGTGRAFNEQRLGLRTEGERDKETPAQSKQKNRHHRGS